MGQVSEMRPISCEQYTQVKVSIRPELATAFKAACAANGATMAGAISGFMETYSDTDARKKGYSPNLSTKRQRRAAVRHILSQLERIRDNEENYVSNIPVNLQGSDMFIFAEYCVSLIDEAYEALDTAYMEKG